MINMWGGPCSTKTTQALGLAYHLRLQGIEAELVTEYAKEPTWMGDLETLKNQAYVTSNQIHRQFMVDGKVKVAITDSPILLGLIYEGFGYSDRFKDWLVETFNTFNNVNYLLERENYIENYNPNGRNQTAEEGWEKCIKVENLLNSLGIEYTKIYVGKENIMPDLVNKVLNKLKDA
jgi:hypothetical protein